MSVAAAACVRAFNKMAEQSPLTGSADSLINEGILSVLPLDVFVSL